MGTIRKTVVAGVFCILLMVLINFVLPRTMPGDPVLLLVGAEEESLNRDLYESYKEKLGLDLPLHIQYFRYLGSVLRGDLGFSYHHKAPVSSVIKARIPATLRIAVPAIFLSTILALLLGCYTGWRANSPIDTAISSVITLLNAVPSFLLGMVFVTLFSYHLRWFPLGGLNSIIVPSGVIPAFLDRVRHTVLPIATMTIYGTPAKYLMARNTAAAAKNEKYVVYARARGLSKRRILFIHILKNICPPFITLVGMNIGFMIAGSMIIEVVFSINGMGGLTYNAVSLRDFPMLQGCLMVVSVLVIAANIVTDLMNRFIDPKQRYGVHRET